MSSSRKRKRPKEADISTDATSIQKETSSFQLDQGSEDDSFDLSGFMEDLNQTTLAPSFATTESRGGENVECDELSLLGQDPFSVAPRKKNRGGTRKQLPFTHRRKKRKQVYTLDALLAEAQSTEHTSAEDHSESESKAAASKTDEGDVGESHDFEALEQILQLGTKYGGDIKLGNIFPSWPKALPNVYGMPLLEDSSSVEVSSTEAKRTYIHDISSQGIAVWQSSVRSGGLLMWLKCTDQRPSNILSCSSKHVCIALKNVVSPASSPSKVAFGNDWSLAKSCYTTLEALLVAETESPGEPLSSNIYEHLLNGPSAGEPHNHALWVPEYRDIERVFCEYGASSDGPVETLPCECPPAEQEKQEDAFPVQSLGLVIRYITLCLVYRPEKYEEKDRLAMVAWAWKLLLDARLSRPLTAHVRPWLAALLHDNRWQFSDQNTPAAMATMADRLCQILCGQVTTSHANQAYLLGKLPVGISVPWRHLRSRLAISLLKQLQRHSPFQLKDSANAEEETEWLVKVVTALEVRDGAAAAAVDYSLLSSTVSLLDIYFTSLMHTPDPSPSSSSLFESVKRSLEVLNSQIREVRGYNLMVTKVKDQLVLLRAKLDLLQHMKKNKQTLQLNLLQLGKPK